MHKTALIPACGSLGLLAVACFREPALGPAAGDDDGSSGNAATTSVTSTRGPDDAASDEAGSTVGDGDVDTSGAATRARGSEGALDESTSLASSDTRDASEGTSSSSGGEVPLGMYGDACDDGSQCASELCWHVMGTCTVSCEPWAANDCGAQGLTGFCIETEPPIDGACWGEFDSGDDGDDGYVDADDDVMAQVADDDLDIHTIFFAQAGWHWINLSRGFREGTVELRLYDMDDLFAIVETDEAGYASYEVYSPGVGTMHATVTAKDGDAATYWVSLAPEV